MTVLSRHSIVQLYNSIAYYIRFVNTILNISFNLPAVANKFSSFPYCVASLQLSNPYKMPPVDASYNIYL